MPILGVPSMDASGQIFEAMGIKEGKKGLKRQDKYQN
jgi:hypothetical protein